jgi:heme exporter protein A
VSALRAEGLSARYPGQSTSTQALIDINLEVQRGERLLLLGPNGAGKSTFIRVFAGLMRTTRGRALIDDAPARAARAHVGVVSHATFLYDELTALENLRFYAQLYGVAEPAARAAELLERVGIAALGDVLVGRLSRGQQQRVTIARALLHDPGVLLLDEPDTGLDASAFSALEEFLVGRADRAVVLTTHNLTTGLKLGSRVAILSRGKLVHQQASVSTDDATALSTLLERFARE